MDGSIATSVIFPALRLLQPGLGGCVDRIGIVRMDEELVDCSDFRRACTGPGTAAVRRAVYILEHVRVVDDAAVRTSDGDGAE
jgi:hypothetical protein